MILDVNEGEASVIMNALMQRPCGEVIGLVLKLDKQMKEQQEKPKEPEK